MKVISHPSRIINPGFHLFETVRVETVEVWYMGHLIEEKEVEIFEEHGLHVPDPGIHVDSEDGEQWPNQGTFTFEDRIWTVVRDDDDSVWGWETLDGKVFHCPGGKAAWLERRRKISESAILAGRDLGWWDVDEDGNPQKPAIKISIADMTEQSKPLMAHLMVDLGFFPSVSQARKNGWDKPLELGRHELGPRKKRAFVEIIP